MNIFTMSCVDFKVLLIILVGLVKVNFAAFTPRQEGDKGLEEFSDAGRDIYWGLLNKNRTETCILLSGLFEIAIPYHTDYFSTAIAKIMVPRNASVSGFCEWDTNTNVQSMTLVWSPDQANPEIQHNMTLIFVRSRGTFVSYALTAVQANIASNEVDFPDAADSNEVYKMTASELTLMSALESFSYYCKSTQVLAFDDGRNSIGMSLVHAQAFNDELAFGDDDDYGPRTFCAKDGFEIIIMVVTYLLILALIGLGVFYIVDKRSKRHYIYM